MDALLFVHQKSESKIIKIHHPVLLSRSLAAQTVGSAGAAFSYASPHLARRGKAESQVVGVSEISQVLRYEEGNQWFGGTLKFEKHRDIMMKFGLTCSFSIVCFHKSTAFSHQPIPQPSSPSGSSGYTRSVCSGCIRPGPVLPSNDHCRRYCIYTHIRYQYYINLYYIEWDSQLG
jgi:hypothetical protein